MKKLGDIMEDLGFRPDGSDEVKKAFVKNLIRQANEQEGRKKFQENKVTYETNQKLENANGTSEQLSLFTQKKSS